MSIPSNVEQFNTQVKRVSDRLRGGSASPDIHTGDQLGGDGSSHQGAGVSNTQSTAGPAVPSQARKQTTGGKKGGGSARPGGLGNGVQPEADQTTTPHEDVSGEPATNTMSGSTADAGAVSQTTNPATDQSAPTPRRTIPGPTPTAA